MTTQTRLQTVVGHALMLIRWFVRRYATPAERLRSARRRQIQLARTVAHVRASSRTTLDR